MKNKFRGAVIIPFPNKTARWAYGSLVTLKGETYIVPDDAEVDETGEILDGLVEVHPESVGQWTGWQTKPNPNQEDIYDGDLFIVEDVGVCEVKRMHGSWYLGDESLYEFEEDTGLIGWGIQLHGNKTDNPKLLENL